MIFRVVLWVVGLRLGWLNRRSPRFRYAVREKQVVIQIESADKKAARYFEFDRGQFTSRSGHHGKYGLAASAGHLGERIVVLSFRTATDAMRILKAAAKDNAAMLCAIREKTLVVTGDFTLLMWFGWLSEQI